MAHVLFFLTCHWEHNSLPRQRSRVKNRSRLCVCQLVCALTAESFDIRTRNLVEALTLIISRMSSKVKVIGQRSRSPGWKTWFSKFQMAELHRASLSWHLTSCDVTAWRHDVTWHHITTSWRLDIHWRLLSKNTDKEGTSREGASTLRRFHFKCT